MLKIIVLPIVGCLLAWYLRTEMRNATETLLNSIHHSKMLFQHYQVSDRDG